MNVNHTPSVAYALRNTILMLMVCAAPVWASQERADRATAPGAQPANTDTSIAARVNGEPITRAEVQRLLTSTVERDQLVAELGTGNSGTEALERAALRRLIHRRLILQEAARRKLTVPDAEVDKAVAALRRRFDDLKDLGRWMKEHGVDEKSLFTTIRDETLALRVRAALTDDIRVTDDEAQAYYESHRDDLNLEEVRLQIIVVKEKAAADEILAALGVGEDFGKLAKTRSAGARAARGGDTGWVAAAGLWAPLRAVVAKMKPRQAHGPMQRGEEFLIVRLDDRRARPTTSVAEARPEIERRLLPDKHQDALEAWLADRERQSKIEMAPQAERD